MSGNRVRYSIMPRHIVTVPISRAWLPLLSPAAMLQNPSCSRGRSTPPRLVSPCHAAEATLKSRLSILIAFVLIAAVSRGATIVAEPFETLEAWRITTVGAATVGVDSKAPRGNCLRVRSLGGLAMCSRDLPVAQLRGVALTIRCMTRVAALGSGPQPWSTAKIHVAIRSPAGVRHVTSRLSQRAEWTRSSLVAEIPGDATRVLLSLGVENAPADVGFDNLLVTTPAAESRPLDMREQSTLSLPGGAFEPVTWQDVTFIPEQKGKGLALRGVGNEDLPKTIDRPILVNAVVNRICFLQATFPAPGKRETPCMIWTARFWDGHETSFSVFEGRDIGAADSGEKLGNWEPVWRSVYDDGKPLQLGVTTWRLFTTDVPVESLSVRAYAGAAPFIAAITAVADPPPPPAGDTEEGDWDDGGWEE